MKPFAMSVFVLIVGAALFCGESAKAAIFTVNSNRDDRNGACQAFPDGDCTLREAINAANRSITTDTINFAIPVAAPQVISPTTALPVITSPVIINGYSQPQSSRNTLESGNNANITVILDGVGVGGRVNGITGLDLRGGNSTVSGLNIRRYATGISLPATGTNLVTGNFITLCDFGISIKSTSNTIGGTSPGGRNVISNNTTGISISSSATPSTASGNVVQGNFIGTSFSGSVVAGNTTGLLLSNAPNNSIGGTASGARNIISGNSSDGIGISGSASTGNKIEGNFIGTNLTASAAMANGGDGVRITNAPSNIIGGSIAAARNIISGNRRSGLIILGASATNNIVQGNFIGTNLTASAAIANTIDGVVILSAPGNMIGGATTGARNIISGNTVNGVSILEVTATTNAATNNLVQGNFIGTNLTASAALANGRNGVEISNARNNTIGGNTVAARNIISGNSGNGIIISGAASLFNRVEGNFIGTDASGTVSIGNSDGIGIFNAVENFIGNNSSSQTGARNVISGNRGRGISILGVGATRNRVIDNFIGTNAAGSAALPNLSHGVHLSNGANVNTIGISSTNVSIISGNRGDGVRISGTSTQNTVGNIVDSNFIGLSVTGTTAIANNQNGVTLESAGFNSETANFENLNTRNTVSRNTISGNTLNGIAVSSTFPTFPSEIGPFNKIGTNPQATEAVGNGGNGILVQNTNRISITGGNIIAGNPLNGILLEASGGELSSNRIGMRTDSGVQIANGGHGVLARNGGGLNLSFGNSIILNRGDGVHIDSIARLIVESLNTISSNLGHGISLDNVTNSPIGFGTGSPNRISSNGGDGIFVASNCTGIKINNANLFSSNGGLAIDLAPDGPTPNDLGDADTGANQLQNFPVLDVSDNAGGFPVRGTLNSKPNTTYTIHLWESIPPDPTGFGEGNSLLGSESVTTDANGNGTFNVAAPFAQRLEGRFVTATATDPQGNTSEFSRAVQISTVNMTLTVTDSPDPVTAGEILTYTLRATNNGLVTRQAQITITVPPDAPIVFKSATQGTPTVFANRVSVNFGPLEPGGSVVVTVGVRPPVSGTVTSTSTLSGNFVDNIPADNTVTTSTTVLPRVDLLLSGTAPISIEAGNALTYTLQVKNLGRRDANSVTVINDLPEGVEFLDAAPPATTQVGRRLTFNLGPLAVDAERIVTIRVRPTAPGRVFSAARALLGAGQSDPDGSNNVVSFSTTVSGCAREAGNQVMITRGPTQLTGDIFSCFASGSCRLRQVVTVKNNGPTSLVGPLTLVLDNLPNGITLLNSSGTTTCNSPVGSPFVPATPTALAPGASVKVTVEFETSGNNNVTYDPRVLYGAGER